MRTVIAVLLLAVIAVPVFAQQCVLTGFQIEPKTFSIYLEIEGKEKTVVADPAKAWSTITSINWAFKDGRPTCNQLAVLKKLHDPKRGQDIHGWAYDADEIFSKYQVSTLLEFVDFRYSEVFNNPMLIIRFAGNDNMVSFTPQETWKILIRTHKRMTKSYPSGFNTDPFGETISDPDWAKFCSQQKVLTEKNFLENELSAFCYNLAKGELSFITYRGDSDEEKLKNFEDKNDAIRLLFSDDKAWGKFLTRIKELEGKYYLREIDPDHRPFSLREPAFYAELVKTKDGKAVGRLILTCSCNIMFTAY